MAKLVNLMIQEAITARATEIYIQPGADRVQVGYRIDGVLLERDSVPRRLLNPVIARIRNMAILPCVADGPHGGWFKLNFQGESHNVDAAIYQTDYGPSVVLTL